MRITNKLFWALCPVLLVLYNNCAPFHQIDGIESSQNGLSIQPPEDIPVDEFFNLGKSQYDMACASCHGSLELSAKRGTSLAQFDTARQFVPQMASALEGQELNVEAIIYALNNNAPSATTPPELTSALNPKYTCQYPDNRGMDTLPIRRLTRIELENVIRDNFGESVLAKVTSSLELYPKEEFTESVSEFNPNFNPLIISALIEISDGVATAISEPGPDRVNNTPSCLINEFGNYSFDDAQCVDQFVSDFGMKMFRRPLTNEQFAEFKSILNSRESIHPLHRDRIKAFIMATMLSPEFSNHIPFVVAENSGKGAVDSFTLASRISFAAAGTTPDSLLLASAMSNELDTIEKRKIHARRLLNTRSGQNYVHNVFDHYLGTYRRQPALSDAYGNYSNIDPKNLITELNSEMIHYIDHHVFQNPGSFQDLATSNKAFPLTTNAAKVFGTSQSQGSRDPQTTSSGHVGLFMRPALLLSSGERTSPIARGIQFARNVLCTEIPDPDPESLEQAEMSLEDLEVELHTAREQAEHMTSSPACQVCHQYINPPGFFLENFGPFGEARMKEAILSQTGQFLRELPINTVVEDFKVDNQTYDLKSSQEFIDKVAHSTQGMACFSRNLLKYQNLREPTENDGCQLSEIETLVREGKTMQEILIHNAISEDQLWQKTN